MGGGALWSSLGLRPKSLNVFGKVKSETSWLSFKYRWPEISPREISQREVSLREISPHDYFTTRQLCRGKSRREMSRCTTFFLAAGNFAVISFATVFFCEVRRLWKVRRLAKEINKSKIRNITKISAAKQSCGDTFCGEERSEVNPTKLYEKVFLNGKKILAAKFNAARKNCGENLMRRKFR